ncbi:MAG: BatA domain-containing protein [Acidobacteria bacterium]|nr:BatA domain-containing protein [Acidobacteriota bacterium]
MLGLSFLSPLFLLGAAAIAIPIAMHLFYRRAEPIIEFSAMRYLRRAPVEQSRRRRLRELLLLALRVAALLLLAGAFARPYLTESAAALDAPATLVLIDTSASLSGPGQFERARERAAEAVRNAPAADLVGVMAFGGTAEVLAPLSPDRASALAAIARLQGGAGLTRYRAALRRAAEQFGGGSGRLLVVTDLQQSGWDAVEEGGVPERIAVDVEDVGGPDVNAAVTSLRVEGAEAVAIVQSFAPRPMTDEVVFDVEGRRLGAVPVELPAGGTVEARFPLTVRSPRNTTSDQPAAGALSASIVDREGFAADNVRYAVLDPAQIPSILAVTASGHPSEALYLERALAAAEGAGGFRFRAVSGPAFSALDPADVGDLSVVVVFGSRGLEQRGRARLADFVRSGGGLLVAAGPEVEADVIREALAGVVGTSWQPRDDRPLTFAPEDSRHPIFAVFAGGGSLGHVRFSRAALVAAGRNADVLARYSDGSPALVEERTGAGRVLLFASDLNNRWNDFPLQPAFVPFVHETLRYLTSARDTRTEYLVGDLPGAAPGVTTRAGRRVAVNVDARESDPTRMSADEFRAGIVRLNVSAVRQAGAEARDQEAGQRLWQYALLLMVVSLAAEGMLGRRLG